LARLVLNVLNSRLVIADNQVILDMDIVVI
jgi:hypothetical protein